MRKIIILAITLICLNTFIFKRAFSGIVPENFNKKYETPGVLTVDGMSFSATFSPTEKLRESYLPQNLQKTESFKIVNPEIASFNWSGDITKSSDEIQNLKIVILALINKFNKEGRSFSIVSHSWGTVLTYCALKELEKEGKLKEGDVDRLVTLGSPMGKQLGITPVHPEAYSLARDYIVAELGEEATKLSKPKGVTEWVNFYSKGDPFSGKISTADYNLKVSGRHSVYYTNPDVTWKIAGEIAMAAKDDVIGKSINFSQQLNKNASFHQAPKAAYQAIKFSKTVKVTPQGRLEGIPLGRVEIDSSRKSEMTPHQLVHPVKVSFTETFDGLFTQIPDYPLAPTADVSADITDGARTGAGSRPGDFTGSYTAQGVAEPGWGWVEHHNTPFSGATATGGVEAKGLKEGDLKGSMTVNWESTAEKITLTSNKVTIKTDGSLTAENLNGPIVSKSSGATEGNWTNGSLKQIPK